MKRILIILFLLQASPFLSQAKYLDSLRKRLNEQLADSMRVKILLQIANNAGNQEALKCTQEALLISEKIKMEKFVFSSIHTIGNIYYNMGDYQNALTFYLKELKLVEASGKKRKLPGIYNGIGNVYSAQGQLEKALENYFAAIEIIKSTYPKEQQYVLVTYYGNIGEVYLSMKNYDEAAKNYSLVIEINRNERGEPDAYSMGNAYLGLGNIAFIKEEMDKAFELFNNSLEMFNKVGLEQCIAASEISIAKVHSAREKYTEAIGHYKKAIVLSENTNANGVALEAYQGIASAYFRSGDLKQAYPALEKCLALKDTILNESKLKLMDEMEAKYETAKKDKELILQKVELEKQQADAREKSMQRNIFIGAFIAMALLVFAVFRGYSQKKKANAEISKQKEIIEEKQKEIIDSIKYAKRIQKALITSEKYVERNLGRLKKEN